ncbi:MAG: response regulator [Bacteroidetes bacterium]|nr:MAG: response regulator [Bacteroidota bacterium]
MPDDENVRVESSNNTSGGQAALVERVAALEQRVDWHRRAEAGLRLVLNSSGQAIYCTDCTGSITFCNEAFLQKIGYEAMGDVLGLDSHALLHRRQPDGSAFPVEACPIHQVIRTGTEAHVEEQVTWRRDGTGFPARYESFPIHREGELIGCVVTFMDITSRKEAERRQRDQARVLRTLNETNAILAAELDLEKLVQRLVDAGRDIIGADLGGFFYNVDMRDGVAHASYAISGVPRDVFDGFPWPRLTDVFRPTFVGESMLRSDDILADPRYGGNNGTNGGMPPGHPPVRSFLSSPVIGRDGQVIGGLFFGHAMPGRFAEEHEALIAGVANQAAIAITNARLFAEAQKEIAERRRAEQALARARDRAEAANRAKSAFLAKMSHELRTPLNGILGYAQLLQRDAGIAEKQRAQLAVIERSGRHLLTLINDLLDLAKIEAGKVVVEAAPLHLPDLVGSVADVARVQAEEKGLMFSIDVFSAVPTVVQGDERRLRQVLLNLLSNAVKFTERGSVALRVGVLDVPASEGEPRGPSGPVNDAVARLRFEVEDTGIGIPPEQQEGIFEAFEQVHASDHRGGGTGLGLAISRRLAAMMGGTLRVTSRPGQGSLFALEVVVPVLHPGEPAVGSKATRRIVGVRGRPRVLIVDDKPLNRSLIVGLLQPLGFELAEAENGVEALTVAGRFAPDVVLMDLVMPVLDGFETARRFKKTPELAAIPIVALSASVFRVTQQQSLEVGCDAFLPKPIDLEALLDTLERLLGLHWSYAEGPAASEAAGRSSGSVLAEADVPAPAEAALLYDLALRGDVAALLAYLEASDRAGSLSVPFIERLRTLTKRFRMQEIRLTLEPYLHRDHDGNP